MVGIAKSGMESARLLKGRGDTVFITEAKNDALTRSSIDLLVKEAVLEIDHVELGSHTEKFIKKSDLMVVSPGVRPDSLPIKLAEEKGIPIISELELAYSMCPAPIIAVTGTSGKTTTATLIGQILKKAGLDAVVCGNIGNPFSGEIRRIKKSSIVVLEVSSFQLERIDKFKPKICVILNISSNHLDRHKDMEEYISAKSRIFSNQDKEDILFLNGKDTLLRGFSNNARSRVEFFDEYKNFRAKYNIENDDFLAAMSVASEVGAKEGKMLEVIKNFKGIEHRLEHVMAINGIDFINDSKATTVSSVEWALKSVKGRIILIMGGRYKGGDFALLENLVKEKVDSIISIGEAMPQIKNGLKGTREIFEAGDLKEAVIEGFKRAKKGTSILLSPGCSSFDMFKSYEERGNLFKEIIRELK